MDQKKIDFPKMAWTPIPGAQFKTFQRENFQIRLMEIFDDFEEKDWCQKGHYGYVLEGQLNIDFNGHIIEYREGDGICIEAGVGSQHKAIIPNGGRAKLILFEKI